MTPACQPGTAVARASSAARTFSPASSSRFRPLIAAAARCLPNHRGRPGRRQTPYPSRSPPSASHAARAAGTQKNWFYSEMGKRPTFPVIEQYVL